MEKSAFLELATASGVRIDNADDLPESFDDPRAVNNVICDRPRLLFAIAMSTMRSQIGNVGDYIDIHPTAIIEDYDGIGVSGFGFEIDANGKRWQIPQVGKLYIGPRVQVGANVTICRGTIDNTGISPDVIIAHGSAIGHNCVVGERTFLANNVTLAGSVTVGPDCYIGSGAVIKNKVVLAPNVTVGCGAVVVEDVLRTGTVVVGNPAKPLE